MPRVPDNSSQEIMLYNLGRNKKRLEDLQLKKTTLKALTRPSESPLDAVEILSLKSQLNDKAQFLRNSDYALLVLNLTDKSLEQISNVILKAKEITVAQSSDFYGAKARKNVAREVRQLLTQALAISNTQVGGKFLFAGFQSLHRPFDEKGNYSGDQNHVKIEIAKNFFIPVNLHGLEVFFSRKDVSPQPLLSKGNLFGQLHILARALETNESTLIQSLLEDFDASLSRILTLRAHVGSLVNTLEMSKRNLESFAIDSKLRRSEIEDADLAELFSDIQKQQNVLKASYKAGRGAINLSLLDFLG